MRKEFEAWGRDHFDLFRAEGEDYLDPVAWAGWSAWQVSRRAALEEAAKVCEESRHAASGSSHPDARLGAFVACSRLAAAIRALASQPVAPEGEK